MRENGSARIRSFAVVPFPGKGGAIGIHRYQGHSDRGVRGNSSDRFNAISFRDVHSYESRFAPSNSEQTLQVIRANREMGTFPFIGTGPGHFYFVLLDVLSIQFFTFLPMERRFSYRGNGIYYIFRSRHAYDLLEMGLTEKVRRLVEDSGMNRLYEDHDATWRGLAADARNLIRPQVENGDPTVDDSFMSTIESSWKTIPS